jgi:hypothetical protein
VNASPPSSYIVLSDRALCTGISFSVLLLEQIDQHSRPPSAPHARNLRDPVAHAIIGVSATLKTMALESSPGAARQELGRLADFVHHGQVHLSYLPGRQLDYFAPELDTAAGEGR